MDKKDNTYAPEWKTLKGFTEEPLPAPTCHFTRVGSVVTVVCNLGAPYYGMGTNKATISLPTDLPCVRGLVSGTFSSDHFVNSEDPSVGIVGPNRIDLQTVLLQVNNSPAGPATSWCNFSYVTDAD